MLKKKLALVLAMAMAAATAGSSTVSEPAFFFFECEGPVESPSAVCYESASQRILSDIRVINEAAGEKGGMDVKGN